MRKFIVFLFLLCGCVRDLRDNCKQLCENRVLKCPHGTTDVQLLRCLHEHDTCLTSCRF